MAKTQPCERCGIDPGVARELERVYAIELPWRTVCENLDRDLHDHAATVRYLMARGFRQSKRIEGTWLLATSSGGTAVRVPETDAGDWVEVMADTVLILAVQYHKGELGILADIERAGQAHHA